MASSARQGGPAAESHGPAAREDAHVAAGAEHRLLVVVPAAAELPRWEGDAADAAQGRDVRHTPQEPASVVRADVVSGGAAL